MWFESELRRKRWYVLGTYKSENQFMSKKKKNKKQKIVKDSYGLLCKIVVRNGVVKVVGLN